MELGLSVEIEISGRSFTVGYYVEPGGLWWTNVLNLALPPQRHRPTPGQSMEPLSATWLRIKREGGREGGRERESEREGRKKIKYKY